MYVKWGERDFTEGEVRLQGFAGSCHVAFGVGYVEAEIEAVICGVGGGRSLKGVVRMCKL